jgi:dTDP-4-amino-4,6-dideoxygalactose transaminase
MTADRIPILDLNPELDALWAPINAAMQRVLRSGQFINGPDVKEFEAEVAAYMKVKHAVALNSGTDALVIALRAYGIGPGDEVIVPSFTFFATGECATLLGAKPVIVDVDPVSFNIDVAQAAAAITPRTKAIIPVHLFGHAARMDELLALAKKHNLILVEDVAQAFGGEYRGKKLGTIGHVGTYSFFPTKNLGACGDGGMLVTGDDRVAELARKLRAHGGKDKYNNEMAGYNSRLDTLQAAILRVKLPHIDAACDGRRAVAGRYRELLGGQPGVTLPSEADYARHVYHQYTIRLTGADRDTVKSRLAAAGVETMVYYPKPMHKVPVYEGMGLRLPVAERLASEVLSLPIWPQMTPETQRRVASALLAAAK